MPLTKEQIDSLYNQIYETENERTIFHEICRIIEDAHNGVMLDIAIAQIKAQSGMMYGG